MIAIIPVKSLLKNSINMHQFCSYTDKGFITLDTSRFNYILEDGLVVTIKERIVAYHTCNDLNSCHQENWNVACSSKWSEDKYW